MSEESRNVYTIFLSSPADVEKERETVEQFFREQNNSWNIDQVQLDLLTGDDSRISSRSVGNPIETIKKGLEKTQNTFLLYIGIMGIRFGSPTGSKDASGEEYPSGTYAEFQQVLKQRQENKKGLPDIQFFFKDIKEYNTRLSKDDIKQYAKVLEFQDEVSKGLTFRSFTSPEDLRDKLNEYVAPWLRQEIARLQNISHISEAEQEQIDVPEIKKIEENPLVRYAPLLLCFTDPEVDQKDKKVWEFTEVNNAAWGEILGYTKKEEIDTRIQDLDAHARREDKDIGLLHLIHPGDRYRTQKQMEILLGRKENQRDFVNRYLHSDYSYRWIRWSSNLITNGKKNLVYSMGVNVTSDHVKSELYDSIHSKNAQQVSTGDELIIKLAKIIGEIIQYDIFLLNLYPTGSPSEGSSIIISRQKSQDGEEWKEEWQKELEISGNIFVDGKIPELATDTDREIAGLINIEKLRRSSGIMKNISKSSPFLCLRISSEPFTFIICLLRFQRKSGDEASTIDFNRIGFAKEEALLIKNFGLETYLNALQRKRLSEPMQKLFKML